MVSNRPFKYKCSINKRIVFAGFEAADNDYFINEQANSLYVKIEMTGNDTYSIS